MYRPFEASPYQKGAKVGRDLLLRWWSGEKLDWAALRAKYRDERECSDCHESKPTSAFTAGRWKRTDAARVCRECMKRHADRNAPWQCMACNAWKEEKAFPAEYARPQCTFYRVCSTCENTKVCSACGHRKGRDGFSSSAWARARLRARPCLLCASKSRGWWNCNQCQKGKSTSEFQKWRDKYRKQNGRQVCDKCWAPQPARSVVVKAQDRLRRSREQVARRKRDKVVAEVMALIQAQRKGQGAGHEGTQGQAGLHRPAARAQEKTVQEVTMATQQRRGAKRPRQEDGKLVCYTCPFCYGRVSSSIATGQVDHRQACGKRFRVKEGKVVSKEFVYKCPFCADHVESNVSTGQVDHRGTCGRQFMVKDGRVNAAVSKEFVYKCPFCSGHVASKVRSGQVNHGGACGKRFHVKDGLVRGGTRQYRHKCPLCHTTVWSAQSAGRIRVKHRTAAGWPCAQHSWQAK